MDIDLVPTGDENTKWRLLIPEIAYPRASTVGNKPSTTGVRTVNSDNVYNGYWQNFEYHWPSGWGRSEEHTSELQSLMRISYAVFCLKKKSQCINFNMRTYNFRITSNNSHSQYYTLQIQTELQILQNDSHG